MSFCRTAIVNTAPSATVFELFDIEWYHDLEIWVRDHSRSFKPVPFESLGVVSYSPSIATMALSCIICEIEREIGEKWWFFHTPLHLTPPLGGGGSPSEYCHPVWLPDGETRGQSNLTKSASRGAHSPVRGHPRGSKVVPLNSLGKVSY